MANTGERARLELCKIPHKKTVREDGVFLKQTGKGLRARQLTRESHWSLVVLRGPLKAHPSMHAPETAQILSGQNITARSGQHFSGFDFPGPLLSSLLVSQGVMGQKRY